MAVLDNVKKIVNKLGEDSTSWGSLAVLGIGLAALVALMMLLPYYG